MLIASEGKCINKTLSILRTPPKMRRTCFTPNLKGLYEAFDVFNARTLTNAMIPDCAQQRNGRQQKLYVYKTIHKTTLYSADEESAEAKICIQTSRRKR